MAHVETPVLVIAGQGCLLATSPFLSHANVPSVLVERYPTPSPMPRGAPAAAG